MNADLLPFDLNPLYWIILLLSGFVLLILAMGYLWPRFTVYLDDGEQKPLKSHVDKNDRRIVRRRKKRRLIGLIYSGAFLIIATLIGVSAFTGEVAAMNDREHQKTIERTGETLSETLAEPLHEDKVAKLLDGESVAVDVVDKNSVFHSVKFKHSNGSFLSLFTKPHLIADETVDGFVTAGTPWTETAKSQAEGMFRHEVASKLEARYEITLSPENRKELQIPSERPSESFKEYGSTELIISDEYTGYKRVSTFLIWEGEFKLISESPDGSNLAEMNKQGSSIYAQ